MAKSKTTPTTSTLCNMDKFEKRIMTAVIIFGFIAFFILGWGFSEMRWKHYAIVHHAAFYEADSWANVSFHWNDESFAQEPLQDQAWEKVQASIFQKKLDKFGIK
jgi:hypothetical protein